MNRVRHQVVVASLAVVVTTVAACGSGGFSAACKTAINDSLDRQFVVSYLYGPLDPTPRNSADNAPCALGLDAPPDLDAACAQLNSAIESLPGACGDSFDAAIDAVLSGRRQ